MAMMATSLLGTVKRMWVFFHFFYCNFKESKKNGGKF
jgi:hypothetical protein